MKQAAISDPFSSFVFASKWAGLLRRRQRDAGARPGTVCVLSRNRSRENRTGEGRVLDKFTSSLTRPYRRGITARQKIIGQQEIANQSRRFRLSLRARRAYGLGFDYYKRLEHDVNAVTLDDIKKVAAKYFRDQPYVLATVQPPQKSAS
jgi:hypothetical protein